MSNKKIEQLQRGQRKYKRERTVLLWQTVIMAIIVALTIATRTFVIGVALSATEICATAVLSVFIFGGPLYRITWADKKLREASEQLAETNRQP